MNCEEKISMLSFELFFCATICTFFAQLCGKDGCFRDLYKILKVLYNQHFEMPGHVNSGHQYLISKEDSRPLFAVQWPEGRAGWGAGWGEVGGGGLARSRVTTENLQVGPNTSRPFSGTCTTPDPHNHETLVASLLSFCTYTLPQTQLRYFLDSVTVSLFVFFIWCDK